MDNGANQPALTEQKADHEKKKPEQEKIYKELACVKARRMIIAVKHLTTFFISVGIAFLLSAIVHDVLNRYGIRNHLLCRYATPEFRNYLHSAVAAIWFYNGIVTTLVTLIWTFTSSVFVFMLGRIDSRTYGIRQIDLLLALGPYIMKRFPMLGVYTVLFLSEPFLMILALTDELKCLFWAVMVVQLINMLILLLYIVITFYRSAAEEIIKIQAGAFFKSGQRLLTSSHLLLLDMINNLNYNNNEEVDALIGILNGNVLSQMKGSIGRTFASYFVNLIARSNEVSSKKTEEILRTVFLDTVTTIDARKGILRGLMEVDIHNASGLCVDLISSLKDSEMTELLYWCFLLLEKKGMNQYADSLTNVYHVEAVRMYDKFCILSREEEDLNINNDEICSMPLKLCREILDDNKQEIRNDRITELLLRFSLLMNMFAANK